MGDRDAVNEKPMKEWPGIAEKRIICAKLTAKRFAFSMPAEVPGELLAFLASTLPAELRAVSRQLRTQMQSQNGVYGSIGT